MYYLAFKGKSNNKSSLLPGLCDLQPVEAPDTSARDPGTLLNSPWGLSLRPTWSIVREGSCSFKGPSSPAGEQAHMADGLVVLSRGLLPLDTLPILHGMAWHGKRVAWHCGQPGRGNLFIAESVASVVTIRAVRPRRMHVSVSKVSKLAQVGPMAASRQRSLYLRPRAGGGSMRAWFVHAVAMHQKSKAVTRSTANSEASEILINATDLLA